jgi:hypothetical protein
MKAKNKCAVCEFENGWKQAVYDHIGEKHLPAELQSSKKKQFKRNNTKYKCNNCSLFVESYFDLLEHMKNNHAQMSTL